MIDGVSVPPVLAFGGGIRGQPGGDQRPGPRSSNNKNDVMQLTRYLIEWSISQDFGGSD